MIEINSNGLLDAILEAISIVIVIFVLLVWIAGMAEAISPMFSFGFILALVLVWAFCELDR